MTEADFKYDPSQAFNYATCRKSHNAFKISFGAKAPCVSLFDIHDEKKPGTLFIFSRDYI